MTDEIRLADVTKDNWAAIAKLEVNPDQRDFVGSNIRTIAEIQFYDNCYLRAIVKGDEPIGLAAHGIDTDDDNWWLFRFMISGSEQGKGYGRKALSLLIDEWRQFPGISFVLLSYHPDNVIAERLYTSAGFVPGEMAKWNERIARLDLAPARGSI